MPSESFDRLERAVDDVLVRGLVTTDRLQTAIHGHLKGMAGAAAIRRILGRVHARSAREPPGAEVLGLLRSAGLPEPEIQYSIREGSRLLARVDFAYPELRLAIEVDSLPLARRPQGFGHVSRRNELTNRRWSVLHITKEHMSGTGALAVALVREARSPKAEPTRKEIHLPPAWVNLHWTWGLPGPRPTRPLDCPRPQSIGEGRGAGLAEV